eukprot:2006696-Pleurochrysis_carterae.AAC.7
MTGSLLQKSQLNIVLILCSASYVVPTEEHQKRQEVPPPPMSMRCLADTAEPLVHFLGTLMAPFEDADAPFRSL